MELCLQISKQKSVAPLGVFMPGEQVAAGPALVAALRRINRPLYLVSQDGQNRVMTGTPVTTAKCNDGDLFNGVVPPCALESLGDASFCRDHGIDYPYVGGAMAKGISSVAMVEALAKAGMLGFFGAAGLLVKEVEAAIDQLEARAPGLTCGFNLIHSPNEPELEDALVDLYLRRRVTLVEASAFLALTPALVRYRTHGLSRDAEGRVVAPNRIIGKVSREEVAAKFFAPPPEKMVRELVEAGHLTTGQAEMAAIYS